MTSAELRTALEHNFPPNAKCWSYATDEVRDMSRRAREMRGLCEVHAVDFRSITSPAEWNTRGINSIIEFYEQMTTVQQENFVANHRDWIEPFER